MNTGIGVDPGSGSHGYVLVVDGQIMSAGCEDTNFIVDLVTRHNCEVVIEDIRPYSLRLTPQVIDTCKNIGEMLYRLKSSGIASHLIPRSGVKEYVFNTFPSVVIPRVNAKIKKKGLINKDGEQRKASYVFVDDRIVIAAMKELWNIETPKPGKSNKYGLKDHSWQALAVLSVKLMPVLV